MKVTAIVVVNPCAATRLRSSLSVATANEDNRFEIWDGMVLVHHGDRGTTYGVPFANVACVRLEEGEPTSPAPSGPGDAPDVAAKLKKKKVKP